MKRKLPYLLSACLLVSLAGCRSARETLRVSERSTLELQNDVKEVSQATTGEQVQAGIAVRLETKEESAEETTVIIWSAPDQCGKQYPVQTTVTVKGVKSEGKTAIVANRESVANAEYTTVKEDRSKQQTRTEAQSETVSQPVTPAWKIWLVIILSVGALVMIYLVLKRFRIVK